MPPLPKPAATRQRRHRITSAATISAGPAVKCDLPDAVGWHPLTLSWWNVIWASPMVAEWVDADVPALVALGKLVDAFWCANSADAPKIHAEIRMASREFGLSPMSRRSLQWEVKRLAEPVRPVAAPVRRRPAGSLLSVLSGGKARSA